MKDEMRRCGRCKHEHAYGIRSYSTDNVALYGPRPCGYMEILNSDPSGYDPDSRCHCRDFVEYHEGVENALTLTDEQNKALWEKTGFLNAQVPAATRMAVAQIETLEGAERDKAFMSLMLSQVTDIRGAMTKDESKFAHLVAHTDEVVESMRGVAQLKERLDNTNGRIVEVHERIDQINDRIDQLLTELREALHPTWKRKRKMRLLTDEERATIGERLKQGREAKRILSASMDGGMLRDEAVVTDAEPADDK